MKTIEMAIWPNIQERKLAALERIATALEKLVGMQPFLTPEEYGNAFSHSPNSQEKPK